MNTPHCQFYVTDNNERQNMTPLSIISCRRDIS